jgi:uridine kinase
MIFIFILLFFFVTILYLFFYYFSEEEIIQEQINFSKDENEIVNKFTKEYSETIIRPYVIGISGGSGSGKTYISNIIIKTIYEMFPDTGINDVSIINQDSYYFGGDDKTNYDIPTAIDFDLLKRNLEKLISGYSIDNPLYDFNCHKRKRETKRIYPTKIIIVEGILIFTEEKLRKLFDLKVFVSADAPTQIFRRIDRDTRERGRTITEVSERYHRDVWPSYKKYVLPSAKYADLLINNFSNSYIGHQVLLNHIVKTYQSLIDM